MMGAALFLAVFAALSGWKGATVALGRMDEIDARKATWVGVGLILWVTAWAFVCNQVAGT